VIEAAIRQEEKSTRSSREENMWQYLAYALFGFVMIGCLVYIMDALETEEPPKSKRPDPKK
jgi:hypothetical protein